MLHYVVTSLESAHGSNPKTCATIKMTATEQLFSVVLFIMVNKVVLTFESVDIILKCNLSIKTTDQYFPVVLFIMFNKVVPPFESQMEF